MSVLSAAELLWLTAGSSHGHMETQAGSWEGVCCLLLNVQPQPCPFCLWGPLARAELLAVSWKFWLVF